MTSDQLRRIACAAFSTLFISLLAGCGGGGPTTHAVSGKITYKGNPVADAQVGFVPTDTTGAVKPASGQTDASGNYTLRTYLSPSDNASGAMAGNYKVTVAKGAAHDAVPTHEEIANFKSEIPVRYADTAQTPLTAEVTAGGANAFSFQLDDK
jgi:hypothetical protein